MNSKKILIVDDTSTNIDILLELIGKKYEILVALDGTSALEILDKERIDLVLLDIMMPEMDGFEVCQHIRDNKKTKEIPIIFITAKSDEKTIEEAYAIGGSDYITKPFKPLELLARIKTQLKLRTLIENLEYIASYDAMTGIYNRRKFFEIAVEIFDTSKENLFAIMIDIDKFKNVNDTYGHPVGDLVIKNIATCIKGNLCKESVFGRVGGEEFAILCHKENQKEVKEKIELLRTQVELCETFTEDGTLVKCTISEGIAMANPQTKSLDALLKIADEALYTAKGDGRNKVIFR